MSENEENEREKPTALIRSEDAKISTTTQAIHYARLSATLASVASSVGFLAVKSGTHLGFSFAKTLTTTAITVASSVTETTLFGTRLGTDRLLNYAVNKSFNAAEAITFIPIELAHAATNASLVVASSSIEGVSHMFGVPKDDPSDYTFAFSYREPIDSAAAATDAKNAAVGEYIGPFSASATSFTSSIPSLVRILQHEWYNPKDADQLPTESYSALSIARALVAWASIQKVTRLYHEERWLSNMLEIQDWEWRGQKDPKHMTPRERAQSTMSRIRSRANTLRKRVSSVHVVSDVQLPNHGGELLLAEIGERLGVPLPYGDHRMSSFSRASFISVASSGGSDLRDPKAKVPYPVIRSALRRFSRMVLGGYGGAGMILFGVQLPSLSKSGNITAGFNEDGKGFRVGYTAPTEPRPTSTIITPGDVAPTAEAPSPQQATFNFNLNFPSIELLTGGSNPSASKDEGSIPFPSRAKEWDEKSTLEHVVEGAEQSDEDDDGASAWDMLEPPSPTDPEYQTNPSVPPPEPTWWSVLMGKHDQQIFEAFATSNPISSPVQSTTDLPSLRKLGKQKSNASSLPPKSVSVDSDRLPRFWVLTDHGRQQIVLVLRGTMSLNEVAIDLACDVAPFTPASTSSPSPSSSREPSPSNANSEHQIHEGMYTLARLMGRPGMPVQKAVADALNQNEGYELVLCGHSLGAGVASVLGLMWADPETCLTVRSSGLPEGRPISVFCFAPPCVMSPELSRLAASFVTSFIYSHDTVARLSLGAVRDLKRVTTWLSYSQQNNPEARESPSSIIRKAFLLDKGMWLPGMGVDREEEEAFFLSVRKTLEANMQYADLFPPGRIFWAMRDSEFGESVRRNPASTSGGKTHSWFGNVNTKTDLLRVFEVEKVEEVFDQVVFARDMVTSHFVQNYDKVLHDYL